MEVRLVTTTSTRFLTLPNDAFVSKSLEVYGEWSYGEIVLFSQILKSEDRIIEVGANIGGHTVFLARDICTLGMVYAFEPRRILFQLLCANLMLNGAENVFCFQVGLGESTRTLTEGRIPLEEPINAGGFEIGKVQGSEEVVNIVPLDNIIDSIKPISLIKADIEGHELKMLYGGRHLIARDRPMLYLENDRVDSSKSLLDYLLELKYDVWWHTVPLFRKTNFARTQNNIFGTIASFNVLCIPNERNVTIHGLEKVEDINFHPLKR